MKPCRAGLFRCHIQWSTFGLLPLQISENGNVSFGGYEFHEIPSELPLLHHHPLIAGFWTDIHASIVIYYAEMNDSESDIRRKNVFRERASKIKALLTEGLEITEIEDFIVTEMFIITWVDSTTYCTPEQVGKAIIF